MTPRDPWVDAAEANHEFCLSLCKLGEGEYDATIIPVGQNAFRELRAEGNLLTASLVRCYMT